MIDEQTAVQTDWELRCRAAERTVAVLKNKVKELYNEGAQTSIHKQLERAKQRELEHRNHAAAERQKLQEEFIAVSRQAGMAEIAVGVLHNVGNVLNSVNTSAHMVRNRLRKSRATTLKQACDLLQKNEQNLVDYLTNDPQGQKLPLLLARAAEAVLRENEDALVEIHTLERHIEHIERIVAKQQSYAKVSSMLESIQVEKLVEDAIQINDASLIRHDIRLERHFARVPSVITDKHKVMQILVNLIKNAKEAVSDLTLKERHIELRIVHTSDDMVSVSVTDNGVGISAENLERIFTYGFTTKSFGHGFGLHACSITAKELCGTLSVDSPGENLGATFTLSLPIENVVPARFSRDHEDQLYANPL
ncbi:sensor histidine kinase [Aeoliella mucimassa]|nr:ATP-binding protein [Aeoliella mucimassa]